MCKAQSEGGQRCSSHGRQNLIATRQRYASTPDSDPTKIEAIMAAEIEYASTPEGIGWVELQLADDPDDDTRAYYERIALKGANLRERNQLVAHTNTLHDSMSYEDVLAAIHARKKRAIDTTPRYGPRTRDEAMDALRRDAVLESGLGDLPPDVLTRYAEFVISQNAAPFGAFGSFRENRLLYKQYALAVRDAYDTGLGHVSDYAAEKTVPGLHRWSTDEIASRTEALPTGFRLKPRAYRKLSASQQKMYDHIQEGRYKPEWVTPDFTLNKAGHDEGIKRYEDWVIEEVEYENFAALPPRHVAQHAIELSWGGREAVQRLYAGGGDFNQGMTQETHTTPSRLFYVLCCAYEAGRTSAAS